MFFFFMVLKLKKKLTYQFDKHPINPSEHIMAITCLRSERGNPSHQNRGRLLIKTVRDLVHIDISIHPVASNSSDPYSPGTIRMLIGINELYVASTALRHHSLLVGHIKE